MANWFASKSGWDAVTAWAASTAYSVGDLRRQSAAPTQGNERVWRCTTAGTSGGSEPAWTLTKGSTTNDGTAVWTEVTGNSTYNTTGFAAPHATILKALAWAAAGDTVYVDTAHTYTWTSAITFASPGTASNPVRVICISTTHSNPPVAADVVTTAGGTATEGTGTSNQIVTNGNLQCYGIIFSVGSGANTANAFPANDTYPQIYENCTWKIAATSGGKIDVGGNGQSSTIPNYVLFKNCVVNFNNAGHSICIRSKFDWIGGSLTGTVPTNLIQASGGVQAFQFSIQDVDLNSAGTWTSKYFINASTFLTGTRALFKNCKIASGATVLTGTLAQPYPYPLISMVTSDSGAATYREEHYQYAGSVIADTSRYRSGGASDGTTPVSWACVSLSGAKYFYPLICPTIYQWVSSTGSKTVTLYFASGGTLQDVDIGFDVEYLGTASSTATKVESTYGANGGNPSSTPNPLATGTNLSTDASSWTGTGVGTVQKVTATITVNTVGIIAITPKIWKASTTVYVDPLVSVA